MTKRERVIAALNFRKTDYAPYQISFTGQMHQKMAEYAGEEFFGRIDNHLCQVDLSKAQTTVGPELTMDEYGVVWNKSGADKDIGVIDSILLEDTDDLDAFEFPPVDEAFVRHQMEQLVSEAGDRFRIAGIGFSLFERAWTLRGMENLLCDMMAEPEFVHKLLKKITERNLKIIDIALEYDFDGFYFGDDWGQQRGLIMGPKCWREFIKPRLAELYGRVRGAGKYVLQHSCGDIREIMEDLYDIGLNAYNTFQPEIYGYDYAPNLYGKITIWGGISTQRDLPVKTPEEIRQVTRDLLAAFPCGGLIAAPTHDIPGDAVPENVEAMLEVLESQKN
ncbi:MAG: uroporphyrinogen decarboxylase [Clostridia bacterium]|nr:uroporphyrinogen decarboxylase [Clostridia bacterium]